MLARLQLFITLGLLGLSIGWALWWWQLDRPLMAIAGILVLFGGHAVVLAIEFLLVRLVNRQDPAPRASGLQLLAAWWGEVRAATRVFLWRQPFRSRRWPDRLPASARGRRGLLLVHGFVCNRGLWNPWLAQLTRLDIPFVAVNLEPVFGSIDEYAPVLEAAARRLEEATGLEPVVVAHSMGGLAVRYWLAGCGGVARVHHVITIGTPHRGTWLARFALSMNGTQMRLASPWHSALAAREQQAAAAHFTCFYGHCDNIVMPASTATLPGAHNRHLAGVAHVAMTDRPEVLEEALRRLRAPEAGVPSAAEPALSPRG